jgi:hypothetical protein
MAYSTKDKHFKSLSQHKNVLFSNFENKRLVKICLDYKDTNFECFLFLLVCVSLYMSAYPRVSAYPLEKPCLFFFSFIIHMCIRGLVHFSPLPPPPPLPLTSPPPSLPYPLNTQQKLFCPYF